MMDLAGAPLVGRIIERVKRCKKVDEIVLATTQKPEDDVLEELGHSYGISVFRGSENDLVDRYYQAARAFNADVVVRLPADNPCPELSEIDRIIAYHLTGQSDFSSNLAEVFGNGYPDGLKGVDIPLAGRIAAITDAFDALTSKRPYRRKPFSLEKSFDIIREGQGSHFASSVVDAFFAIKDEILLIKEECKDQHESLLVVSHLWDSIRA